MYRISDNPHLHPRIFTFDIRGCGCLKFTADREKENNRKKYMPCISNIRNMYLFSYQNILWLLSVSFPLLIFTPLS